MYFELKWKSQIVKLLKCCGGIGNTPLCHSIVSGKEFETDCKMTSLPIKTRSKQHLKGWMSYSVKLSNRPNTYKICLLFFLLKLSLCVKKNRAPYFFVRFDPFEDHLLPSFLPPRLRHPNSTTEFFKAKLLLFPPPSHTQKNHVIYKKLSVL